MHEWFEHGVDEVVLYQCIGCGNDIIANERYFEVDNEKVHFSSECSVMYMINNYVIKLAGEEME